MDNLQIKICRLCFTLITSNKYDPLDGPLKMMLGLITPDLKFNITCDPVICKDCSSSIQNAFDFKTNFFEVEEIIETKKEELNISYPNLSDLISCNPRGPKFIYYCRTCLLKIEDQLFIDLKRDTKKEEILVLQNCLFEMDTTLTSDCKICLVCFKKLQEINKFKLSCLKNEEVIDAHLMENQIQSGDKINLISIVSGLIKRATKLTEVKTEPEIKIILHSDASTHDNSRIKREKDDLNTNEISPSALEPSSKGQMVFDLNPCKQDSKGRMVYECPESICSFTTIHKYNIQRHLARVHRKNAVVKGKRFYKCLECDYNTVKNHEMMKHLLNHPKTDAYKCTECSYTNNQKTALISHIFSHIDQDSISEYRSLDQERRKKRSR